MRKTVNIYDDVLEAAQDRAHAERRSLGAVLSDLAREGLTGGLKPHPVGYRHPRDAELATYGIFPLPARGGIVTQELIDRIREEDGM